MQKSLRIVSAACIVAVTLVAAGCGKKLSNTLGLPNQPPTVRLASAPPTGSGALQVSHRLSWTASDPDGRVDHYLIATNPRSVDRVDNTWREVREQEKTLTLRRATPGALRKEDGDERELAVFAVRAVDDRGAVSAPAYRAMFADNIAPSVQITSPRPSHLTYAFVPPTSRIRWQGDDPDGAVPSHLAKYKFKLLADSNPEFPIDLVLLDPDSLRRFYAPTFVGWDSVPGDSLGHTFTGLEINRTYVFAITGFDIVGDYDPVFSLDKNLLLMRIGDPHLLGPRLTLYNDYFNHTYPSGQFFPDPAHDLLVDALAGQPFTLHWFGQPASGAVSVAYRWALDIADVNDETRRHGERDLDHWTAWSATTTSASVGPFHAQSADQPHRLFVEAQDSNGSVSLGIVRFTYVHPTFESDLLIVDDTRLVEDRVAIGHPDSIAAPLGPWPTAAELDTFLYARGGVQWRMYPTGTLSRPGLFAGYHYDTLGTRTGQLDPTVPLAVLGRYRHVLWILDQKSALNDKAGNDPTRPISALRYMSGPNRENTLAAYSRSGGHVWLLGGGAGGGSASPYDRLSNGVGVFSSALGELAPGTMMFDIVHWRSEFKEVFSRNRPVLTGIAPVALAAAVSADGEEDAARAPSINYGLLPTSLEVRDPGSDPVPPLRTASTYYNPPASLEYLSLPNEITEERTPRGRHPEAEQEHSHRPPRTVSVLDSLYRVDASDLPGAPAINTCMTLYHGSENGQVIFSGFDVWTWQRSQCVRLVDGVLQGIWGLSRDPVARIFAAPQPVVANHGQR